MTKNFRIEKDSMGTIEVPMEALWGGSNTKIDNKFFYWRRINSN